MPRMKLFICHSKASPESVRLAQELAYSLREDYEVFFDEASLPAGQSFDKRIWQAIQESDGMIFLASPQALEAGRFTLTELKFAKNRWTSGTGKVLPVLLDSATANDLDAYLSILHFIQPAGNARAEILAEVRRMWPANRKRRALIGALVAPPLVALIAWGAVERSWVLERGSAIWAAAFGGTEETPIADPQRVEPLLALIRRVSWTGTYESIGGCLDMAEKIRPTTMSVSQVLKYQADSLAGGASTCTIGAYKITRRTLESHQKNLRISAERKFSPQLQDRIALEILRNNGLKKFIAGDLSLEDFGNRLAELWGVLPVLSEVKHGTVSIDRGYSYYSREGDTPTSITVLQFERVLKAVRSGVN